VKRIGTIVFRRNSSRREGLAFAKVRSFTFALGILHWCLLWCLSFSATFTFSQDISQPSLVFNPISIELDSNGIHTLTFQEVARVAAGSSDPSGIASATVKPATFDFCDLGTQTVTLSLIDSKGNSTNRSGPLQVLAPAVPPHEVYVDVTYPSVCAQVGFPCGNSNACHFYNLDSFNTIQAAIDHVAENGIIHLAPGTYVENPVIFKPLSLVGPNAGIPGDSPNRRPEARLIPLRSDPENGTIVSVESDDVVIDGFLMDGSNPSLSGGYNANGVRVHAAAGVQNGTYPDLADVAHISVRNNIITNISYDGICLDRYQYFGTSSAWNYIENNKLANMWEGILTYALDSVIANNVISNVTHGLGVHCVNTAVPNGFFPLVASNTLTIAQWWPVEIQVARAPGIWINYRRDQASPISVLGNVVNTPVAPPFLKTVIGLYALTVDGDGKIDFIGNTVNGGGNCTVGMLATCCWSNNSVKLVSGSLNNIGGTGVLADTLDDKWGPGDCRVTVSNVKITLRPAGTGVLALQNTATPAHSSLVTVVSNTTIVGGSCGVEVNGTNASASVVGNGLPISANDVGIYVQGGRALIEGNNLTNNRAAAILVQNNGVVDAGDCSGANITRLGSGNGVNGASAGLNDFSGYGFHQRAPWAITNSGVVAVMADRNIFTAAPGDNIRDAVSGPVTFSDSGNLVVSAPAALAVQCLGEVPAAAITLEEFLAAGGVIAAGSVASISARDTIVTNRPGRYTITRSYTLAGGCNQPVSCSQIITARDEQGPVLHCSDNLVRGVDPGCDYATVTFTNLAADSCGEILGSWEPVSTGQFPIGTNTVIVIATDLANNSSACTFSVAVVGLPVITRQPLSRTNNAGTAASFTVIATSPEPMSFRWKKNGIALRDGKPISGATSAELLLATVSDRDAGDYSVDVSNSAGVTSSTKAHLSVVTPNGNLRVVGLSAGEVTLEVSGPAGNRFALLTSTNLVTWAGIYTNTTPFRFAHATVAGIDCRFYRALRVP
jgi:hypothetical protein